MHISDNNILLYLTQYGLTEQKRQNLENHFVHCEKCNERIEHFSKLLAKITAENRIECEQIENDLIAYQFNELDQTRRKEVEQHLRECENCQYIVSRLKGFPGGLKNNCPQDQLSTAVKSTVLEYIQNLKSKIGTVVTLITEPLTPAPAYLGKNNSRSVRKIKHAGGNIVLNVGEYGLKTSLLSLENIELDVQITDECGLAIFQDFLPGEYQIYMKGIKISNMKYHNF